MNKTETRSRTDGIFNFLGFRFFTIGIVVAVSLVLGVGFGIYFAKRHWPLISQFGEKFRMLEQKYFWRPPEVELPNLMSTNEIKELIAAKTPVQVESGRKALRNSFHGAQCLTDSNQTGIDRIAPLEDKTISTKLGEYLYIRLPYGFESRARYFRSERQSGILLIYHTGHSGQTLDDTLAISTILKAGIDVVAIDMPMSGQNNQPVIAIPNVGRVRFSQHDQLRTLETDNFNPLVLFVEPIACLINHFSNAGKYQKMVQVGFSGGGNIASLYAALDTRILKTFSVAGQYPVFLRQSNPTRDWGDYEQVNALLSKHVSDLDLYVMAAHGGRGRTYVQVFNQFDPCCYAGRRSDLYSQIVAERVRELGLGKFEVWFDDLNYSHSISSATVANILSSLNISDVDPVQ